MVFIHFQHSQYNLHLFFMLYQLILIVLLLGVGAAYNIKITCQPCSCNIGTCLLYDGGPFNNQLVCTSCTSASQRQFDIGCSCSLGCGYTATFPGRQISGCATNSDPAWPYLLMELNSYYSQVGLGKSYVWCGGVCIWPILGVVIGVIAGVGFLIALLIYLRKRQASKRQDVQMAINTTNTDY